MKTAEEILNECIREPNGGGQSMNFDNALKAMELYRSQSLPSQTNMTNAERAEKVETFLNKFNIGEADRMTIADWFERFYSQLLPSVTELTNEQAFDFVQQYKSETKIPIGIDVSLGFALFAKWLASKLTASPSDRKEK